MALVLAQAIEETSLRTAQQGTMSAGGDDEPGAAAASLHGLSMGHGHVMVPSLSSLAEKRKQRRIRTTFTSSQLKVNTSTSASALDFALTPPRP